MVKLIAFSRIGRLLRSALGKVPLIHAKLSPKRRALPKSITVFLYGGFGDTMMKLAAIRNLPADVDIQLVVSRKHEALLGLVSGNNITRFVIRSWKDLFRLRLQINRKSLFLFQSPLFEIYLIYLVLGFSCGYGFIGDRSAFRAIGITEADSPSTITTNDHDNYLHMAALYGVSDVLRLSLLTTPMAISLDDYAIININKSQGWPAGRWSTENFLQVAEFVSRGLGIGVVLVGAQNEADQVGEFEATLFNRGVSQIVNVSGKTSFAELAGLVSRAKFVLTCDAFIMHLASYFDVPAFSVFSFSDPAEFVWGNNTFSFNPQFSCMPCVSFATAPVDNAPFSCPYGARCDTTVSADEVIHKIRLRFPDSHRIVSS